MVSTRSLFLAGENCHAFYTRNQQIDMNGYSMIHLGLRRAEILQRVAVRKTVSGTASAVLSKLNG